MALALPVTSLDNSLRAHCVLQITCTSSPAYNPVSNKLAEWCNSKINRLLQYPQLTTSLKGISSTTSMWIKITFVAAFAELNKNKWRGIIQNMRMSTWRYIRTETQSGSGLQGEVRLCIGPRAIAGWYYVLQAGIDQVRKWLNEDTSEVYSHWKKGGT